MSAPKEAERAGPGSETLLRPSLLVTLSHFSLAGLAVTLGYFAVANLLIDFTATSRISAILGDGRDGALHSGTEHRGDEAVRPRRAADDAFLGS